MTIKLPGGLSTDSKYLSSLFDREEQLGMLASGHPWTVHVDMAVRFPRVIPWLCEEFTAG